MNLALVTLAAFFLQNAAVQGVVLRGANDPLAKAVVELRIDDNDARLINSATTEEDGRFIFPGIRPGRYRIGVTRQGYARPSMTITVVAGQNLEMRLPMTPTGSINGLVRDNKGEPFGNIEVQAFKAVYSGGQRVLQGVQSTHTNDLGEYRLFWLQPGRYYVAAVHPKAQGIPRITSGGAFMTISMAPGPGAFFAAGAADPAVAATLRDDPSDRYVPVYFPGTTSEKSATRIEVRAGSDFGGVNFIVGPVRARHVRGFVIDASTGRPGEYTSVEEVPTFVHRSDDPLDRTGTGAFDLELMPGIHTLAASSSRGSGSVTIEVGDQDIENLNILTSPFFNIEGHLVFEGQAGAADLEEIRLTLRHDPPPARENPSSTSYSNPREDGAFLLEGSLGDFRVNVAPILNVTPLFSSRPIPRNLQNAYVKSIRFGNVDVLNNGLHIDRQTTTPLEIVLGNKPGTIDGAVRSNNRPSAGDLTVVLVPNVRRRYELFKTTTTDSSGRFHFDHVPPGNYTVFAWAEVETDSWFDPEFMRSYEDRGMAVQVGEDAKEQVQVTAID